MRGVDWGGGDVCLDDGREEGGAEKMSRSMGGKSFAGWRARWAKESGSWDERTSRVVAKGSRFCLNRLEA